MRSSRHVWSPRRSVAAFVWALASTFAVTAHAEAPDAKRAPVTPTTPDSETERPRAILLLRTPGDDDTMSRLRFELKDGGWRILELRHDERFESEPLGTAAEREGATAAVRVDRPRGSAELWVRAPQGPVGETFSAAGERAVGQVLALRVAEALRARGLLLPPAAPRAVEAPAEPARPIANERAAPAPVVTPPSMRGPGPRLSLELGPGVSWSPGGLAPLAVADAGVRLELARVWSLSVVGVIPLVRQRIGGAEGEAEISTFVVGGLGELEWARFSFGGLRSGVGAGAAVSTMSGRASSGFESAAETVLVFTPLARTSFHAGVTPWLRLRAGVAVGATLPTVRVAFGSREVARWGGPFVISSVAVEVSPLW
jgi:hypothetical protein